jgi:BirA family transcriptional regulator, biotin operon repressor / biotin---[acetyl-CoA-carboxylase] ligase
MLGAPRLHLREVGSTSDLARELAIAGAPHGALVTAAAQTAGRGRQGRAWTTPPGAALAMSVVLREPPALLPLVAAVAVAEACGPDAGAQIKWPNDVLVGGRKVAGILAEGRPHEGWAVLGIGVNVAVRPEDLPPELRKRAASLELPPAAVEPTLSALLSALERRLAEDDAVTVHDLRARDALHGLRIDWGRGHGVAAGIDDEGRLLVDHEDGTRSALDAGEVHLAPLATP